MYDLKNRNHSYIAHLLSVTIRSCLCGGNDTNCSFLPVLNELEGLCRSGQSSEARSALAFLRADCPQIRYVTSKGEVLPSSAALISEESDMDQQQVCSEIHPFDTRSLFLFYFSFFIISSGVELLN